MKLDYDDDDHIADFHDSDLDDIQDDPYHSYGSPPQFLKRKQLGVKQELKEPEFNCPEDLMSSAGKDPREETKRELPKNISNVYVKTDNTRNIYREPGKTFVLPLSRIESKDSHRLSSSEKSGCGKEVTQIHCRPRRRRWWETKWLSN